MPCSSQTWVAEHCNDLYCNQTLTLQLIATAQDARKTRCDVVKLGRASTTCNTSRGLVQPDFNCE